MAKLQDWENIISAHCNGAPLPAMMDAVRDAAIEFCRDTSMVRETIKLTTEPLRVQQDIPDTDDNLYPGSLISLHTPQGRVRPLDRRMLEQLYPDGWEDLTTTDCVDGWISERPGFFRTIPHLTVATQVTLEIAFQPKRNAVEVPQFLYELYAYEIGYGALAILHNHNAAPYADSAVSGQFYSAFRNAIQTHSYKASAGFGKGRLFDRKIERP